MEQLIGLVFTAVTSDDDTVNFWQGDKVIYKLMHFQDCCESVYIESIVGDLSDLVGTPILVSEESSQSDPDASESGTWSFFKIATVNGWVDIRFYGSSNGYYGESAYLVKQEF